LNEDLKRLIELQKTDAIIMAKGREADLIPRRVAETSELLEDAKRKKAAFEARVEAVEKARRDREGELVDQAAHIRKIEDRASSLKTNTEYQAHLKEVEKAKEKTGAIEEKILILMEERDQLEPEREGVDRVMAEATSRWEAAKRAVENEGKALEEEIRKLRETRTELAASIAPDNYRRYMDLMERHKGHAVASASGEICHGCHLNMPPQHFNDLKKNQELAFCPACGRIVYYKEE